MVLSRVVYFFFALFSSCACARALSCACCRVCVVACVLSRVCCRACVVALFRALLLYCRFVVVCAGLFVSFALPFFAARVLLLRFAACCFCCMCVCVCVVFCGVVCALRCCLAFLCFSFFFLFFCPLALCPFLCAQLTRV